jgi:hypothetical protein
MKYEDLSGLMSIIDGVESPHFVFLLSGENLDKINDKRSLFYIEPDKEYIPYGGQTARIKISDEELKIILSEVGIPFLRFDEIEYAKDEIIEICILPVIQEYFKFFPLIKEEVLGSFGANVPFKIKYPPMAYHAIPYYVMGGSGGSSGGIGAGGTAFAFMSEQFSSGAMGGGSGKFGRGISYRGKSVPGFVGLDNRTSMMSQMESNQGMLNYFRRERVTKVKEGDDFYATGFSTVGGIMNIKWCLWSNNWDDIRFEYLNDVRDLCTAKVLQSLGMLRSLSSVEAAKLDFSLYTNRAKELRDPIITKWGASSSNMALGIMRGAG